MSAVAQLARLCLQLDIKRAQQTRKAPQKYTKTLEIIGKSSQESSVGDD